MGAAAAPVPIRGWVCVAGGALLHFALGTIYCWGSLNTYVISYMRQYDSMASFDGAAWVFACALLGQASAMFVGGAIERRLGPRATVYIGGLLFCSGVFLSYFTVKNLILFCLTYGLLFGLGIGVAYPAPIVCGVRWMPEKAGLVSGCVVAGFGAGAFVFNFVQTAFINPNNVKPSIVDGKDLYFTLEQVEHVPVMFLMLGGIYAGMMAIGGFFLVNPPSVYTMLENQADPEEEKKRREEDPIANLNAPDASLSPMQMLKTRQFWFLWFMFLCNGQTTVFISIMYKVYGQNFIADDRFLTIAGSFAAIFNALGRICWGRIADIFSIKVAFIGIAGLQAAFVFTFTLAEKGGQVMYFIWVCVMFFNLGGNFSVFPAATNKCFGPKYFGLNYGVVFASQVPSALVGAFLIQTLRQSLGFTGSLLVMGGFSAVSFLAALFFQQRKLIVEKPHSAA